MYQRNLPGESPVFATMYFQPVGIAILRLQFVPEPSSWLLLACGLGLLGVLYRRRC